MAVPPLFNLMFVISSTIPVSTYVKRCISMFCREKIYKVKFYPMTSSKVKTVVFKLEFHVDVESKIISFWLETYCRF